MSLTRMILEKQWLHVLLLALLLAGLGMAGGFDGVRSGQLWAWAAPVWFWLAAVAVVHQVYVWFCWRTQLHAAWL